VTPISSGKWAACSTNGLAAVRTRHRVEVDVLQVIIDIPARSMGQGPVRWSGRSGSRAAERQRASRVMCCTL
jgi:hypothetical protein